MNYPFKQEMHNSEDRSKDSLRGTRRSFLLCRFGGSHWPIDSNGDLRSNLCGSANSFCTNRRPVMTVARHRIYSDVETLCLGAVPEPPLARRERLNETAKTQNNRSWSLFLAPSYFEMGFVGSAHFANPHFDDTIAHRINERTEIVSRPNVEIDVCKSRFIQLADCHSF